MKKTAKPADAAQPEYTRLRNGETGICRCDKDVTYISGTNGYRGNWYHRDPHEVCPVDYR